MCDGFNHIGIAELAPPHALRNRGMCDQTRGERREGRLPASRSSKPRDVRQAGYSEDERSPDPPHALRNRGMCDSKRLADAETLISRLTLFETAGCATHCASPSCRRPMHRLTLFETAGCATAPAENVSVAPLSRLTLFETAGCATATRSLSGVPRHVLPPHALRNRGMCDRERGMQNHSHHFRLTLFETAGCATVNDGNNATLEVLRLTLFETAGCAT